MAETMEQYMSKTRANYGSGIARPKIDDKDHFELKGQFLKELRDNTFSGSDHEDANEHIEKVLENVDLFHIPNITQDQIMLRAFPMSLTRATSRWLRNKLSSLIKTWEDLKEKLLCKYCLPDGTTKKMEEINNFQQEPDETLYQAWERFEELLMKCPQHYLTEMQEVILFYNGLKVPTRQILDSKGAIPTKTAADTKVSIQEMAVYSQNGIMEHLGQEVYVAKVGYELCKGPHYTKVCSLKEEGKTLEESYYTQFGAPFQQGGKYRVAALGFYQRNNTNPSYQERRQSMEESLSKFMSESTKRHEENYNLIKEIRASTDAAIRNQGALIKTLENQIWQMSKSFSTTVEADMTPIRRIGSSQYVVSAQQNRASVSVMTLSTYLNLGLGELAHTKLTVELTDKTMKHPKGIAKNVLVGIGKFIFPIDFIILDMPKDVKVPLILGRPFLSTAHAKIDVFKRKITLRVGDEKINFKRTMAGLDIDTLTMEQYLALSRENQASGMVKLEIEGNVNFEIKSQFMRELREDAFSGNKYEDAHDHIDRVLSIVGLFNIPGVTKDAVMLQIFPFTLIGAAKRWVDKLAPGTINTWDLLKKDFIQRYCPPSMTANQLEDIHNFKQEGDESLYQA
ncbi:hypothetical protein Tco_1174738 [Tanacetum coccineum]